MEYKIRVKKEEMVFDKLEELIEFCKRSEIIQGLIEENNK